MSLSDTNWRAEALEFAKQNDSRNHMVVQLVEAAMKRGAAIVFYTGGGAEFSTHSKGVRVTAPGYYAIIGA